MDTHTWRQRLHIVPALSIVSQLLISLQGKQGLLFLTRMRPTEPHLVSLSLAAEHRWDKAQRKAEMADVKAFLETFKSFKNVQFDDGKYRAR
jgi:hypothetical protein